MTAKIRIAVIVERDFPRSPPNLRSIHLSRPQVVGRRIRWFNGHVSAVPAYAGPFGKEQAERLYWRAGFGPREGDAERLAKLGVTGAVRWFTRPARSVDNPFDNPFDNSFEDSLNQA